MLEQYLMGKLTFTDQIVRAIVQACCAVMRNRDRESRSEGENRELHFRILRFGLKLGLMDGCDGWLEPDSLGVPTFKYVSHLMEWFIHHRVMLHVHYLLPRFSFLLHSSSEA